MARLLGIDVGTSGCKLLVIDETGRILASAAREYPLSTPHPGWSEQNPEHWWMGVQSAMAELDGPFDAIGLTGQMHGSVFLDAENRPIRPALLWNDARTIDQCEEIEETIGAARLRSITGNPMLTGFTLPKILWLKEHEPENFARLRKVILPKDYIRLKLSGVIASDVADASGFGALDLRRCDWSATIMQDLGLDPELLPRLYQSWEVTGKTADGVPIVAGAGDQAAAAVGTGAVVPGIVSISLGTSGVVFSAIAEPEYDRTGSVHTFCHATGGYHAMGVVLSAGGGLRWYRDTIGGGRSYDEIGRSAAGVPAGAHGLTFAPYLAGERAPHNDAKVRGAFVGASLAHGVPEFDRAVFEGVSFAIADAWGALFKIGAKMNRVRVTSGGAKSALWTGILADLFETPLHRLEIDEGPAFGAAILAGVGIGIWRDVASASAATVRESQAIEPPGEELSGAYARYRKLYPLLQTLG